MIGLKSFLISILSFFGFSISFLTGQDRIFTKPEMVSDLNFLKVELELKHPNLYTYSSKEIIDDWFQSQIDNLSEQTTEREAFILIASISSILKDGHSYIYPSLQFLDDFRNSAPLFPLDVFLFNDNLVVVGNNSHEKNIPIGSILKKINGVDVKEIQAQIVGNISRDGDNLQYPMHLYYQFFSAYYSSYYGFQENYLISFLDLENEMRVVDIMALNRTEIRKQREPTLQQGIKLDLLPDQKSAVLTIRSFDNGLLKNDYDQKFKSNIKKIFKLIEEEDIQYLAIDLRGNQGGALSNGVFLLKYFMSSSFQTVDSYYALKRGEKKKLTSRWDDYFSPNKRPHFDGELYVFLNGGSYSCSAIVANTIKKAGRGKMIGEMSGGSAFVNSGGPNEMLSLPNTKVAFTIPKTQYVLRSEMSIIDLGVEPDIHVLDNPTRIYGEEDNFINAFMNLVLK